MSTPEDSQNLPADASAHYAPPSDSAPIDLATKYASELQELTDLIIRGKCVPAPFREVKERLLELLRDKARLDWLEKYGATPICSRTAIDAAMAKDSANAEGQPTRKKRNTWYASQTGETQPRCAVPIGSAVPLRRMHTMDCKYPELCLWSLGVESSCLCLQLVPQAGRYALA